jgi:hypothetical protein
MAELNDPYKTHNLDEGVYSPQLVAKLHQRDDTDASKNAHHHSLGPSANQASPGNHNHDGTSSTQLLAGVTLAGAKGGNIALGSVIAALVGLGATDSTTP